MSLFILQSNAHRSLGWPLIMWLSAAALFLPSCGSETTTATDDTISARTGCEAPADRDAFPPGFTAACRLYFDDHQRIMDGDEIENARAVDVFDLGPLAMGDRIDVQVNAVQQSRLDPMIALFDADGHRVFWNDDLSFSLLNFNAAFAGLIRHDSTHYFLAVTNSNLNFRAGAYEMIVELQPGVGLQPLREQAVRLQWTAQDDVVISGDSYGDLGEFDASSIDALFAGRTGALQKAILAIVRQDYAPYNVLISTTDDPEPDREFSTIFFSDGPTTSLFGLADDVDFFNEQAGDNAIVFLNSYRGLSSDLEEIAQGIANVVSHEIGHTLGLMHTADITSLMDTTGADETLLVDQSFKTSELFDFPIGTQDAPVLLKETVGLRDGQGHGSRVLRCGTCGATLAQVN